MKRWFVVFAVAFPSAANLVAAFSGSETWWVSAALAVLLGLLNAFVWRTHLYAIWLGIPLSDGSWAWSHRRGLFDRQRFTNAAAVYTGAALRVGLSGRASSKNPVGLPRLFLAAALSASFEYYTEEHPDFMSGRAWRKAVPQLSGFIDAYCDGYGYGPEMSLQDALKEWEDTGFNTSFIGYMQAVGAGDAAASLAAGLPLEYAAAMRSER